MKVFVLKLKLRLIIGKINSRSYWSEEACVRNRVKSAKDKLRRIGNEPVIYSTSFYVTNAIIEPLRDIDARFQSHSSHFTQNAAANH